MDNKRRGILNTPYHVMRTIPLGAYVTVYGEDGVWYVQKVQLVRNTAVYTVRSLTYPNHTLQTHLGKLAQTTL